MTKALSPYPGYWKSGMSFLGELPEGWGVRRLKHVTDAIVGGATPKADQDHYWDGDVVWVTPKDVVPYGRITESERTLTKAGLRACSASILPAGSIILTSRAPVGQVAELGVPASTNQGCKGIVIDERYLRGDYALAVLATMRSEIESRATGSTFAEISAERIAALPIPVPPLADQLAMVRFIRHMDSRIRPFMRAKERVVELLEEEKQAIVYRAVTRGLEPSTSLKPSGVDWLGEVPAHWGTLDLGRMIDLLPGYAFSSAAFSESEGDMRLLRGVNVAPGRVRWDEMVRWPSQLTEPFDAYHLAVGDLVIGLDRPIVTAGIRVARITDEDTPSLLLQRVARIRVRSGLLSEYLEFLLRGELFRRYIAPIFTGISVPHLSPEQVRRFRIALPPLDEQSKIVTSLADNTVTIDGAIKAALRQRALLDEFRARLIADIVMGKLDVREAAENLPDDLGADDPALDERLAEVAAA
jgi:type I restriction enzyme S subunit